MARGLVQTGAVAGWAHPARCQFGQFLAYRVGFGFPKPPFKIGYHALEGVYAFARGATCLGITCGQMAEANLFITTAKQNGIADTRGEFIEDGFHIELIVTSERLEHLKVPAVASIPTPHRAIGKADAAVTNNARRIKVLTDAETVAVRAGTLRRIERKATGLKLGHGIAAASAGIACREHKILAAVVERCDIGGALAEVSSRFK